MVFGDPAQFAIEIGPVERYPNASELFVQFRFWISGTPVGDWDDRISLGASLGYLQVLCDNAASRHQVFFRDESPHQIFNRVYEAFFEYDYSKLPAEDPNLRDRFHLDGIGMGAIDDKYGIVLVSSTDGFSRIVAKDIKRNAIVGDVDISNEIFEAVADRYMSWGRQQFESPE